MEKIKLEILGLSPSQAQAGSFALVLGEEYGNRRLPIIIGMFEAQAIAIEIEKIIPNRPMTHDLFKQMAEKFEFKVVEVQIIDIKEGIFYAKIICNNGGKEVVIDARPSDAIAIGIRFDAPIYTSNTVLEEAGISTSEASHADILEGEEIENNEIEIAPKKNFKERLQDSTIDELKKMLDSSLQHEEYEKAAKIRDEIGKRN